MRQVKKAPPQLSVVNLQQTCIAPKESVTYNKQTQTTGAGKGREGEIWSSSINPALLSCVTRKAQPLIPLLVLGAKKVLTFFLYRLTTVTRNFLLLNDFANVFISVSQFIHSPTVGLLW